MAGTVSNEVRDTNTAPTPPPPKKSEATSMFQLAWYINPGQPPLYPSRSNTNIMSDLMAVLHLQFHPGSNAQDAKSPAGSSLQQVLASIAKTPEFQDRRGSCEVFSGCSLGDPDRVVVLICRFSILPFSTPCHLRLITGLPNASLETNKTTAALDALLAPLSPHIMPSAGPSVYTFSRRLRRRDLRSSGVHGLTILRFPTTIADMDEESDDPDSCFQEGLALLEQFGSTAAWGIACDGPGDLIAQLDARSMTEEQATELLLLHVWRSEQAMRRFKDPEKGNAYDAAPPTGFEHTPDDLWDRCWARGLDLLRKNGVVTEEVHVKLIPQS